MKVWVPSFSGSLIEVPFLFRGTSLYIYRPVIRELFSSPEIASKFITKTMKLKGREYVNLNFTGMVERFYRPTDIKVVAKLLDAVLRA